MNKITFWGLATLSLLTQETVTTSVLISILIKSKYSFILFTTLFLILTIIEIFVFHWLGMFIQSKGKNSTIAHLVIVYISKADLFLGKWGQSLFLGLLAASVFPPALTSFISSWLPLPYKAKFYSMLIGDIIWYLITFSIVFGIDLLANKPQNLLLNVLLVSLVFVIFQRMITNRILNINTDD